MFKFGRRIGDLVVGTRVVWWRYRERFMAGVCGGCGYDLRGNVSGGCSECGVLLNERNLYWLKGVEGDCDA